MPRLLQIAFWVAVSLTLYVTLRPIVVSLPGNDKTQHFVAFGGLMLIGGLAYPRAKLLPMAIALSAFGALIELIQPYFGRGRELLDWMADTGGILIALAIVATIRALRRGDQKIH